MKRVGRELGVRYVLEGSVRKGGGQVRITVQLIEAETAAHIKIAVNDRTRSEYTKAFDKHAEQIKRLALRNGGRYAGLSTHMPIEEAMFGSLTMLGGMY